MPRSFPPPPGYTVEGIHGESNGPRMLIATTITLGFAITAVILRMVVKWIIVPSTSWEDYLAIAALLLAIGRTTMLILSEYLEKTCSLFAIKVMAVTKYHQFGQHIWDIQLSNFGFVYSVSLRSLYLRGKD